MLVVELSDADNAGEREFAGELGRWVGEYRIPGVAFLGPLMRRVTAADSRHPALF